MGLSELLTREKYLLSVLESLRLDLNEFTKYPCETVDINQIRYQYDFELKALKSVQASIKVIRDSQLPKQPLSNEFIAFLQEPKSKTNNKAFEKWLQSPQV